MKCEPGCRCDCVINGWLAAECGPEKYRWAIDLLTAEFGIDHVRLQHSTDYGHTQNIAVGWDGFTKSVQWALCGRHPEDWHLLRKDVRWYDLNENRSDLDKFIALARRELQAGGFW